MTLSFDLQSGPDFLKANKGGMGCGPISRYNGSTNRMTWSYPSYHRFRDLTANLVRVGSHRVLTTHALSNQSLLNWLLLNGKLSFLFTVMLPLTSPKPTGLQQQ